MYWLHARQATLHSPTRLDCVFSNCNAHYFTGFVYVLQAIFSHDATCETVHSAFYIQFNGKDDDDDNSQQFTNWSLSKFDCIILDEFSMISFRHSCYILDMLNSLPIFPLTILCGDNRQLKAFTKQDGHIRTVRNLFDNHLLLSFCHTTVLTKQMRCTDLQYNCLLQTLRHPTLFDRNVRRHFLKLSTHRDPHTQVTPDDIVRCFRQCQQTTFLTFSNYASDIVNQAILRHLFCNCEPIIFFPTLQSTDQPMPIHFGMRVIITENCDKAGGFVNENISVVHSLSNHTSFVRCNHQLVAIFPVTNQQNDTYYPIRPVYSMAVAKAQGQTIPHVTIWFDKTKLPTAYVAMSRVATFSCISFPKLPMASHFAQNQQ